ncbi:molybdopterin-dependent oxidoreductase [uncultured Pseudokineococcus sp.]|uniref:molybdopterin-dependent oxidoreductase n=1 Tax=uncultured Pseudokineococcus sp. TaxID=1642928 RepID=UPI002624E8AC|nr:molybdopterin-dependent oxidoreductase [uncultured Pseudokineococcus sp.]
MTTTAPAQPGARPRERRASPGATALAALAGVLAAALTLGVAEVLAAVLAPTSAPVLAVGDAFVDLTPAWLKDFAIATFGTADKTALLVGTGLVLTLLAALAGVLGRRRRVLGDVVVIVLGVVGAVAAATRPDAVLLSPLPSLLGAVAGLLALHWMLDRLPAPGRAGADAEADGASRRGFLVSAGVTGALAAASFAGGRALGAASRGVSSVRAALRLPAPAVAAPPVPEAVDVGVEGVVPWQTPNQDFYRIDTALTVPRVDPATWTLRVHGMVEEEVEISFEELLGSELLETWVTLACVSNEVGGDLISNARWLGLPIREVLARARPTADADMVLSTSVDGWTASTPLEVLVDDEVDAILAVAMNGEPLPTEHGFPVRMVVPGLYGFVSATKWVVDLEVTRFADRTAYWTDRGWSERGPVRTQSRIEVPEPLSRRPAGEAVAAGTAWAQGRGVARVELRLDDGPWRDAELAAVYNDRTWVQWRFPYELPEGSHTLEVRATDETGATQPEERVPPVPDGATGWHSVTVTGTTDA